MLKLNHRMSRRLFVKSGVHLLASIVIWKTTQVIHSAGPQMLAQASASAPAYGRGAYGQGAYGRSPCDQGGCEQPGRRSKTVVSVYLPLVSK